MQELNYADLASEIEERLRTEKEIVLSTCADDVPYKRWAGRAAFYRSPKP
ncbi:MAG: hypothetical protein FWF05_02805 [Oscillospiraceae bacterium]|nr:hypothetical protein [Oscillospiraceae bacterium]